MCPLSPNLAMQGVFELVVPDPEKCEGSADRHLLHQILSMYGRAKAEVCLRKAQALLAYTNIQYTGCAVVRSVH